ncbi:hypothetical protein [Noviherbaspirillum saxi]|uniref:Uncharacterized protein n=1 Tax=Noviherbaspirillum saxi TaxID=2320863 RepID=A0A3A3FP45_9BURK|nr:hypothetical protein [Noviherbaspirillum saxi]RJF97230.1 hypothetical protein D3871_00785 [Noviherbaspirillum saxi]
MFDSSVIHQRTHTGRMEIQEKSHGLTQSERLVLIMIDGVSAYQDVRKKLPVLTDQRFDRAFQTLETKELIVEVFLPLPCQVAEEVERTVIDRFLQQDPLDPVTIIVHDPDEVFGAPVAHNTDAVSVQHAIERSAPRDYGQHARSTDIERVPEAPAAANLDDMHIAMVDSLGKELRARKQFSRHSTDVEVPPDRAQQKESRNSDPGSSTLQVAWPYWCVGIGLAFIAGFFVSKF